MSTRTNLTKSLHTVTAVSNVAIHLAQTNPIVSTPLRALRRALVVLGQDGDWPEGDPTVDACLAKIKARWAEAKQ